MLIYYDYMHRFYVGIAKDTGTLQDYELLKSWEI